MKCYMREETVNYHYTIWYNDCKRDDKDCNLGDIFFDRELQICSVRFYGWGIGILLTDLAEICNKIQILNQEIKGRIT